MLAMNMTQDGNLDIKAKRSNRSAEQTPVKLKKG
jgi:hypothetical protein